MRAVHPTAIVDARAQLADGVRVGAYAIIQGSVQIGPGSIVHEQTVIRGPTIIGRNAKIGPAAYLGMDPQHLKFVADEAAPTYLVIGDNVIVRESARLHRAFTPGLDHATRIGDNCFLMGAVHVAHDCVLERDLVLADAVLLGGHCHIGERAFLGGGCTIHQFVRIGRLAIISGNEVVTQDVPPFGAARYGKLKGYNAVGCRRAAMGRDAMHAIRAAYQQLRKNRVVSTALAEIRAHVPDIPEVREILDFIARTKRGILPAASRSTDSSRAEANVGDNIE